MLPSDPSPPPLPGDSDLSGRQLGDYRLLRRLGKGAMAEVYLAEQLSLQRQVAFKVLKPELATDKTYIQRFQMEARAAAALVHANIVQIYEVGRTDGVYFITQEYVQGQNLAELLAKQGPPDLPDAVRIIRQVAAALSKAARHGIIHRDIKPENLMLASTGEVKVADFGLARLTQTSDQLKLTQVGVTMGSPLYMSPEQVEGKSLDPRSDIYSLGVTCYQMLAGRPPFSGDSVLSVAVHHLRTDPERLENLRPDLPAGLCRMVHKMLEKDPDDRYTTGDEVLGDLRGLTIPGLDEDWPEEMTSSASAMMAMANARTVATQRLASAMQSERPVTPVLRQAWFWIAVAAAFLVGAALAWRNDEPSLLEGSARPSTGALRMSSAEEQFQYALLEGTEQAWQSVEEYFAGDTEHVLMARKQLAELHLAQERYYDALQIFDELARMGRSEPQWVAYGLAGQYTIRSLDGEPDLAARTLEDLWPLRASLDDSTKRRVYRLMQRYGETVPKAQSREARAWLKQHGTEKSGTPGG